MMFTISSCDVYTYATTQDDIYTEEAIDIVQSDVSFNIIIRNGTPFYRNGEVLYYLYNGIYYYPYYYNNYWYVRAYRRPFTHFDTYPYFRPHKYDHRFRPGRYHGFGKPIWHNHHIHKRPHNKRPDTPLRPSRPDNHHGNPGGHVNPRPNNHGNPGGHFTPRPNNHHVTPRNNGNTHRPHGNFNRRH